MQFVLCRSSHYAVQCEGVSPKVPGCRPGEAAAGARMDINLDTLHSPPWQGRTGHAYLGRQHAYAKGGTAPSKRLTGMSRAVHYSKTCWAVFAEAEEYADKGEAGQAGGGQQYAGDPVGKGEGQYHAPGGLW